MNQETSEFVIYIINEISNLTNRPTSEVYQILSKTDCIQKYLVPFYDVLHTLSSQNVVEDVLEYVRKRGTEL